MLVLDRLLNWRLLRSEAVKERENASWETDLAS
jgi:hypothetical protein